MAYLAEDLIASVKRRARIPTAQSMFSTADFLAILNEELISYVVPIINSVREEYLLASQEVPLEANLVNYRIPSRATGGALREVNIIDANGTVYNLTHVALDQVEGARRGFTIDGNTLWILTDLPEAFDGSQTLRMVFLARPGTLVAAGTYATIQSVTAATKTVTLTAMIPTTFTTAVLYEFISGTPGFETQAFEAAATSASGTTMIFAADLPGDLAAGDFVCLANESPVAQIPLELHPLLCQRAAVRCLEALGDSENLNSAAQVLPRMEADAKTLLTPRVQGEAPKLVNHGSLYRTRW